MAMETRYNKGCPEICMIAELSDVSGINHSEIAARCGIGSRDFSQKMRKSQELKFPGVETAVEAMGFAIEIRKTECYRVSREALDQVVAEKVAGKWYCIEEMHGGNQDEYSQYHVTAVKISADTIDTKEWGTNSSTEYGKTKSEVYRWLNN